MADRVGAVREFSRERFVDDDDVRRGFGVAIGEVASAKESCAEGLKPTRADEVNVNAAVLFSEDPVVDPLDVELPRAAADRRHGRRCRAGDTWYVRRSLAQPVVQAYPLVGAGRRA